MNPLAFSSTLLAAGVFGSIGMLAWASAAVLPLLLHLWNRNQRREMSWAAMEFLLAAVQERSRRMRLEQLLLLLLRMSIPVVLALALADPLWQLLPSMGGSLGSRPPVHHMFVVDLSWSMGYLSSDETRLERARRMATEIVDAAPQGDGFTIVTISDPSEVAVGVPVFSADDALIELNRLELRDNVADLASALNLVKQTLQKAQKDFPRLKKHRIHFFSDLGANSWGAALQSEVRDTIEEIETLGDVVTYDVGLDGTSNVGIVSVRRDPAVVTPETQTGWQVQCEQFSGTGATSPLEVEMLVDGKLAGQQLLDFGSTSTASTVFRHQFESSGQHTVTFQLADDNLPVDNRHFEIVDVRDQWNLLCVEGKAGSARNVALALAPTDDSSFLVRTVPGHRIDEVALRDYDVVLLCNPGRMTGQIAAQLRDYLRLGRSVVMFLGDLAVPDNFNELLGGRDGNDRLLPVLLVEPTSYLTWRLAPADYRHPIVDVFRGQERSGLLTTPIWKYMRLMKPGGSSAKVALAFDSGDPAIVEHDVLGGHFTLVAFPASDKSTSIAEGVPRPWTAWSAWPSFPPLVQEMLAHTLSKQSVLQNVRVGQPISATMPVTSSQRFVDIRKPGGTTKRVHVEDQGTPRWSFSETFRSGVYGASIDDAGDMKFAVNLASSEEGKLGRIAIAELPDQFRERAVTASEESSKLQLDQKPLFRWMLGLLLVLLCTESFTAWYLGNAH